jgi:hypothetical protein
MISKTGNDTPEAPDEPKWIDDIIESISWTEGVLDNKHTRNEKGEIVFTLNYCVSLPPSIFSGMVEEEVFTFTAVSDGFQHGVDLCGNGNILDMTTVEGVYQWICVQLFERLQKSNQIYRESQFQLLDQRLSTPNDVLISAAFQSISNELSERGLECSFKWEMGEYCIRAWKPEWIAGDINRAPAIFPSGAGKTLSEAYENLLKNYALLYPERKAHEWIDIDSFSELPDTDKKVLGQIDDDVYILRREKTTSWITEDGRFIPWEDVSRYMIIDY